MRERERVREMKERYIYIYMPFLGVLRNTLILMILFNSVIDNNHNKHYFMIYAFQIDVLDLSARIV